MTDGIAGLKGYYPDADAFASPFLGDQSRYAMGPEHPFFSAGPRSVLLSGPMMTTDPNTAPPGAAEMTGGGGNGGQGEATGANNPGGVSSLGDLGGGLFSGPANGVTGYGGALGPGLSTGNRAADAAMGLAANAISPGLGAAIGAINTAARADNALANSALFEGMGIPGGLSLGQMSGAIAGLNDYGGTITDALNAEAANHNDAFSGSVAGIGAPTGTSVSQAIEAAGPMQDTSANAPNPDGVSMSGLDGPGGGFGGGIGGAVEGGPGSAGNGSSPGDPGYGGDTNGGFGGGEASNDSGNSGPDGGASEGGSGGPDGGGEGGGDGGFAKGGIAAFAGHAKGAGTGTSDSIPARLSNNEFVMTARAVKGIGGGSYEAGARSLYSLMRTAERTSESRPKQFADGGVVTANPDTRSFLERWFTDKEAPTLPYPSADDAKSARDNGIGYESGYENYLDGRRYLDATGLEGKLGAIAEYVGRQKPSTGNEQTADAFTRAAIASRRSGIAALGFDPTRNALDLREGESTTPGFYNYKQDIAVTDANDPSSIIHESLHRGIEKLRAAGRLPDETKQFIKDYGEEMLVRRLMQTQMGGPEDTAPGSVDQQQTRRAREIGTNALSAKKTYEAIQAAETTAAQERARTRSGPR